MTLTNKDGFIDISYLIYLMISALILPAIYTCFLQLSYFSTETLNLFLAESERLSIATFIYHDSLGSSIQSNSSNITFQLPRNETHYEVIHSKLKRQSTRTQYLTQFLNPSSIKKVTDDCLIIKFTTIENLELCIGSF
tara:strand:- start:773 stop:1186 length:414 start_codon:yes stop_codon:yes gene_type:complete